MSQVIEKKGSQGFFAKFELDRFLPGLLTGITIGAMEIVIAMSLASLIFSRNLAVFLPYGIGLALAGGIIMTAGTSLVSRVQGVIGSVQDSPTVILAVIATGLFSAGTGSVEEKRITILVTIALASLLTGLLFLGIGVFRLGKLVRFVPYPVIGGFLAGTGWLLLQGSFGVMTDVPLTVGNLPNLLRPEQLLLWLPAVAFAMVLFFGLRRWNHLLVLPGLVIGFVAVFYLVLAILRIPLSQAMSRGLLLGVASGRVIWQPLFFLNLTAVNWGMVLGQSQNIAVILVLSVVGLLLNIPALELAIRQEIDLNRELRSAGFINLLSGVLGGLIGYHALSNSSLSYRMGARGKLPGIMAGVVMLGVGIAGTQVLAYFPRPLLGALLFFLGFDFLWDWIFTGWSRLSRSDYGVVVLILTVIAATNFLVGVGVGLAVAVLLFVLQYSRISVIHHQISGAEMHSSVERCAYHRRALREDLGQHIQMIQLQGFIFFGTANLLLDQVRERIINTHQPKTEYLILDFSKIDGIDSSAENAFLKEKHFADTQGFVLVLTNLPAKVQTRLEKAGLFKDGRVFVFSNIDLGLEWCEERLLDQHQITGLHTPVTISAQLADSGLAKSNTKRLIEYLERSQIPAGEILIQQGASADQMYFIEMGCVSVYLEMEDHQRVRMQSLGLGTAVGDLGIYRDTHNTATVLAESPVIAYRLTRDSYMAMKAKEPELAATFHEYIAQLLSERLAATTRTLEAVMR